MYAQEASVTEVFATRLKKLREVAGYTQAQLADKLGVSRGSISYYENRERVPDINFLEKASFFFGVIPHYLLGYSNTKTKENEAVSFRLGLSDGAIECLSENEVDGEFLSKFLENEKFKLFMSMANSYCESLGNSTLNRYQDNYTEFLLTKAFFQILVDIACNSKEKKLNHEDSYKELIPILEEIRMSDKAFNQKWEQYKKEHADEFEARSRIQQYLQLMGFNAEGADTHAETKE